MKALLAVILALLPAVHGGLRGAQQTDAGLAGQAAQSDSSVAPRSNSKDERRNTSGQKGSITGQVLSESGQGLMFAQVWASIPGGLPNRGSSTSTDEDGGFQLVGLPARAYTIIAYASGYVFPRSEDGPSFYRVGESLN